MCSEQASHAASELQICKDSACPAVDGVCVTHVVTQLGLGLETLKKSSVIFMSFQAMSVLSAAYTRLSTSEVLL
jgi:hypothetical protein